MILEMAKTGRYGEVALTEADLEQMEKSFGGKVPVTVGHEISGNMPAAGWVKNVHWVKRRATSSAWRWWVKAQSKSGFSVFMQTGSG